MTIQIIDYNKVIQKAIDSKNAEQNTQNKMKVSFIPKQSLRVHFYEIDAENEKIDNCKEVRRGVREDVELSLKAILNGGLNNILGYVDFIEDVKGKQKVVEEVKNNKEQPEQIEQPKAQEVVKAVENIEKQVEEIKEEVEATINEDIREEQVEQTEQPKAQEEKVKAPRTRKKKN